MNWSHGNRFGPDWTQGRWLGSIILVADWQLIARDFKKGRLLMGHMDNGRRNVSQLGLGNERQQHPMLGLAA